MITPSVRLVDEGQPHRRLPRKVGFTVAGLTRAAIPSKGRTYIYDARTPALAFCVTNRGHRSFYLYRRVNGRPQRVRIGGFPELTIEQARDKAAMLNGEIAQGIDPQARRRAVRGEMTLGQLFDRYLEQHAKPHKRTWKEDEAQFERHLSTWRNRKLSTIRKSDVVTLHGRIGTKPNEYTIKTRTGKTFTKKYPHGSPVAANRVLELLRTLFNLAASHGFAEPNPVRGIRQFPEQSRERFLHPDEMPKFFKALNEDPSDTIKDFFTLALMTGARRGNLQELRWEQLNLDRGTWEIPAENFKTGQPTTVHLPSQAIKVLSRRKRTSESPWVFPGKGAAGHLVDAMRGWRSVLKRAGINNLRIHDLRRTLGSWQAAGGASLPVIGKSLGHRNQASTAIYARLNLDPVRTSVNSAVGEIMKAAHPKPKRKSRRGTA